MKLADTPVVLASLQLPAALWRLRSGPFALVEHVWHLADLEAEFDRRIARLVSEDAPFLPDFDGERVARERGYLALDPADGLRAFAAARAANLAALARVTDWTRAGQQEGVGRVTLGQLPRRMLEHDLAHFNEIADLLEELAPGHAQVALLRNDGPRSSSQAA